MIKFIVNILSYKENKRHKKRMSELKEQVREEESKLLKRICKRLDALEKLTIK